MADDGSISAARRLGVELRRLRRERGLAQRSLCKQLSLASHSALVEFESGRRIPGPDVVAAYERQFRLPPGSLGRLRLAALAERAGAEARRAMSSGDHGSALTSPRPAQAPRQLPRPVPHFTGRQAELELLDRYLRSDAPAADQFAAISGMGGVGKTALAVHWGHLARPGFPDGDLYLDMRGYHPSQPPMTPSEALGLLLAALGVPAELLPISAEERAARFRTLVTGRRMLLVLDNARAAAQVRPLLPGCSSCAVLVTSRSRLGGIVAREGSRRVVVDVLAPAEARRLLRQVIGRDRAGAEPEAVTALAELCAGHPLALRIAAERVSCGPRGTIAAAVERMSDQSARLDALATGDDEAAAIRTVFTWSYDALDAEHQYMFRVLGLHEGPEISVRAAAALAGRPVPGCGELLRRLTEAHLLEETALDRFRLHDLLQLLARDLVLASTSPADRSAAVARASSWYLHSACAARAALTPPLPPMRPPPPVSTVAPMALADHAAALAWFEAEQGNLVAASASAVQYQDFQVAWQLATALYGYFDLRKQYADWIRTHLSAATAARSLQDRGSRGQGAVQPRQRLPAARPARRGHRLLRQGPDALRADRLPPGPGQGTGQPGEHLPPGRPRRRRGSHP